MDSEVSMIKSRVFWYIMMTGALAGWAFALRGFFMPYESERAKKAWKGVLLGWALGHPLELVLAFPVGRAAGFSAGRTVLKTILFGFTWWVPVSLKVFRQKG